jgi:hypothetical protein
VMDDGTDLRRIRAVPFQQPEQRRQLGPFLRSRFTRVILLLCRYSTRPGR